MKVGIIKNKEIIISLDREEAGWLSTSLMRYAENKGPLNPSDDCIFHRQLSGEIGSRLLFGKGGG